MIYISYLDEFGQVGPYVSRGDPRHNDSPEFGFAGFLMSAEQVRAFGTWFFQRKCEPPFHLESHRYQTVQAADWIAAPHRILRRNAGTIESYWDGRTVTRSPLWTGRDVSRIKGGRMWDQTMAISCIILCESIGYGKTCWLFPGSFHPGALRR